MNIVSFISALVTIEEAGRGWGSCFFKFFNKNQIKKKLVFAEWDTDDESTQRILDAFKCNVASEYKEHIFQQDEIEEIAEAFLRDKSDWKLDYFQREEVRRFIRKTFENYNEYNVSNMSVGERIIDDSIERVGNKVEVLSEKLDDLEQITHETKEKTAALLKGVTESDRNSFLYAVYVSKNIKLDTIDNTINGEYSIDRKSMINRIKKEARRFISIQGNAGTGKSALCKTLIMDEEYVLFARAEEMARAINLKSVWNCELDKIFDELSDCKIVILIDALEFIADYGSDRYLVLQELYDIASERTNVFIITTCRTTDRNAFIKLHTKYDVVTYEVEEITEVELDGISKVYPIISHLRKQQSYSELLKTPFYINLVVTHGLSSDDITDENDFRDYIWKNIICLKEKASYYGLESSAVCNTVNKIVFERAKKFLLGIRELEIQTSILRALTSEGIVTVTDGLVRLKYDIFEDICFEQYFDKAFEESRGNLSSFYEQIISLGECVYRRYQIWIANKLFVKSNRSKFIYGLLFSGNIDGKWKKQTEIGIVKSKYCEAFFNEFVVELKEKNLIDEFLDVINLYAFEVRLINNHIGHDLKLLPVGKARECIIQLVFNEQLYIGNRVKRTSVIKICLDYARNTAINTFVVNSISNAVCRMMEYYLEIEMSTQYADWYYSSEKRLGQYLTIEYMLAGSAKEWLYNFFEIVKRRYLSGNSYELRWANDISVWTLNNAYPALTNHCREELCELANCIFFEEGKKKKSYYGVSHEQDYYYGLSDNASRVYQSRHDTFKYFLINLFRTDFKNGLGWAVSFTNKAFGSFAENKPDSVINISIYFPDTREIKEFYANDAMWMCRVKEYQVPTVISDIVYYSKEGLIEYLEHFKQDQELFLKMGEWIKKEIYGKSNNVAIVSIIQEIGFHFQKELPGYAVELASSFELLHWDIERYLLYHPAPAQKLLERQIMLTMGIPELKERYVLDQLCDCNLQEYVSKIQLLAEKPIREKAIQIIDHLYELVDNGTYKEDLRFQAQKMDLRNPSIKDLGHGYYEISPSVPVKVVNPEVEGKQNKKTDLYHKINACINQANEGLAKIEYEKIDKVIDELLEFIKSDDFERIHYENNLVQMIVISLTNKNITTERRGSLCKIWALGVRKLFKNDTFAADIKWVPILLKQLDEEMPQETIYLIKQIILDSIIAQSDNGQIQKIADYSRGYLETNSNLANIVFMAIIKLAEDEMNHQKFDAEYLKSKSDTAEFEFLPNIKKPLRVVNGYYERSNGKQGYESKKEKIIQDYLLERLSADHLEFDLHNYDIRMLCAVSNCGLTLTNNHFYMVIRQIILGMINNAGQGDRHNNVFRIIGAYAEHNVIRLFQREIGKEKDTCEKAFEILFDDIDFSKFKRDIVDFYLDIFRVLISYYFDAYQVKEQRLGLEEKIKALEKRINAIDNSYVKTELTQAVAMIDSKFYADWGNCKTSYSEKDKRFLNQQYAKYGHYHIEHFLYTLYQMHINELLPDILLSVEKVFVNSISEDKNMFSNVISGQQWIVDMMILDAYLYNSDEIKEDEELSNAYIHILEMMIEQNNEKAAVLLDEFLIH